MQGKVKICNKSKIAKGKLATSKFANHITFSASSQVGKSASSSLSNASSVTISKPTLRPVSSTPSSNQKG